MTHKFSLSESLEAARPRLIKWAGQLPHALILDSNNHQDKFSKYLFLAALGDEQSKVLTGLPDLQKELDSGNNWLFGHLSFELKNQFEDLESKNDLRFGYPGLSFFIPHTIIFLKPGGSLSVESERYRSEDEFLADLPIAGSPKDEAVHLKVQTSKSQYLETIARLKDELQYGNIYEINHCIEFLGRQNDLSTAAVFNKLNSSANAPFSGFYRNYYNSLLCASPERYLQKTGSKLISQPIKGTAARGKNPAEDSLNQNALLSSEKERSENVMITDLVRNDLSRTAKKASVKVEELFGLYSFNTVHQLITTISSEVKENCSFSDILKATFPMGSMTGAPKVSALKLIDRHETFAREIYSGSLGYISPNGDFDFNVVIRSLLYNSLSGLLSARVGSAITIHCRIRVRRVLA